MFLDTDLIDDPSLRETFTQVHEFEIREFLFTDEECKIDVEQQMLENKVKTMFKTQTVLKPMFAGDERDKALTNKLNAADDTVFYKRLLEFYTERGQPIDNIPWNSGHSFQQTRSCMQRLFCRKGGADEAIGIKAQLSKPLWFPDETI